MENDSPFASYLRTNYSATQEETVKLTEFLVGPISKLNELQDEIARVKAYYNSLVEKHMELSLYIERHQTLMAPVRRLSVDVIQEIFIHCLPTTHNAVISAKESPILLTCICSSWRRIALSTAALWTSIHIPIPQTSNEDSQLVVAMTTAKSRAKAIKVWLARSGDCVLNIFLFDHRYNQFCRDSMPSDIYDVILDALIPFSRRWGTLTCQTPAWGLARIAAIPASDLPRLHTLTIYGSGSSGFHDVPQHNWADSGVLRAPSLRAITFHKITENFAGFPLSWNQLTKIAISDLAWYTEENYSVVCVAKLLAACPLLRHCRLDITESAVPVQHPTDALSEHAPKAVVLRYLEHLTLSGSHDVMDLSPLLDALDVPALEQLDICVHLTTVAPLLALLRRTADTLRDLTLDPGRFCHADFFTCLSACSGLTALSLHDVSLGHLVHRPMLVNDIFLRDVLVPGSEENFAVPPLQTFTCRIPADFSDAGVLEAVHARRAVDGARVNGWPSLSRVKIVFGRPQQQPVLSAVEDLAEVGVACELIYSQTYFFPKSLPTDGAVVVPETKMWGVPPTF
ncbi:hypothetical protein HYPSUDRAFT_41912 [Hypholoma sublateritium FD-334 SS-4]|uniref:F-box domain-containing protein n=1 Tax=Hypholoma sublateritium (strain FD-334 SS-4) TaxID=945553 RepID=A0A0D2NYJ1_HYPSF|nr:hypothetical protein HYPSUDRAFT_41912 [Hypholoma sublateritium FD-334 SS-4]